jgi:hypothetical protein
MVRKQLARRFGYWFLCLSLSALFPLNISWWLHYHHLLPRDGFLAGSVAGLVGAMVLAYRDVRGS